jgi:exodeoxyribonuclease V gamma subunit
LEAGQLAGRWCDLQQTLLALGEPEERRPLHWEGWCQELCWRGDSLVLLHTAKARGRHLLDLWLQLLLAAAADAAPRQAVLVARGEKGFGIQQRLGALDADTARQQLAALATLRESWRQRCWPVPPETGWAWLRQGERQAVGVWEGSDQVRGERQEPEQALCFGPQRPGVEMLQPPFDELATAWAGPLLAHLESSRP